MTQTKDYLTFCDQPADPSLLEAAQLDLRAYAESLRERGLEGEGLPAGVEVPGKLWELFVPCYMNTAETTFHPMADGTSFVLTGDIEAMWLRDSALQVYHYLPVARTSEPVRALIRGLILRQMQAILYDPYANSFNIGENDQHWDVDRPKQKPAVWEQKYEIDSLCFPFFLLDRYLEVVGDRSILEEPLVHAAWATTIRLWRLEQKHEALSNYYFIRKHCPEQDTIPNEGKGRPCSSEHGLTWCGFRPSDDACYYPYLIPSQLFAVSVLERTAELFDEHGLSDTTDAIPFVGPALHYKNEHAKADLAKGPERSSDYAPETAGYAAGEFAARTLHDAPSLRALQEEARDLAAAIRAGVQAAGVITHPVYGEILAYEVDGLGKSYLMDDANIPSLLALPYLGIYAKDDALYRRTRKFILSDENPFYYSGKVARGIGSPHTPEDYVWHIALNVQCLTTDDPAEINEVLQMLANSDADTGFMHEGFHKDDPTHFTRPWFAWSNSMLAANLQALLEH